MTVQPTTIILTALLTACITLVSVYLTNRASQKRELEKFEREDNQQKREFKQNKAEELYDCFSHWEKEVIGIYLIHLPVFIGRLTYAEAQKLLTDRESSGESYRRINTLVNMYFPTLKSEFKAVMDARDKCAHFLGPNNKVGKEVFDAFSIVQDEFSEACTFFLEKVCDESAAL